MGLVKDEMGPAPHAMASEDKMPTIEFPRGPRIVSPPREKFMLQSRASARGTSEAKGEPTGSREAGKAVCRTNPLTAE
jgi:hypothetical protein